MSIQGIMARSCQIQPLANENDRMYERSENYTWFANSVNCVIKWSKTLKEGVRDSVGVGLGYTVPGQTEKSENLAFSFFL